MRSGGDASRYFLSSGFSDFKKTMDRLGIEVEPEIFPAATDSRYFRLKDTPCFGFSPISNTPVLLHDHNEFLNSQVGVFLCLLRFQVFLDGIAVFEAVIVDLVNLVD
jgi:aminoacylase